MIFLLKLLHYFLQVGNVRFIAESESNDYRNGITDPLLPQVLLE